MAIKDLSLDAQYPQRIRNASSPSVALPPLPTPKRPAVPTLAELEARLAELEGPQPPATRELSPQQRDEIDARSGVGRYAPNAVRGTSYDPRTGIQAFGVAGGQS